MDTPLIPQTYEQWHHCIAVLCDQALTREYIDSRIEALNDPKDYMTKKYVQLYGEAQRIRTLNWFKKAKSELGEP